MRRPAIIMLVTGCLLSLTACMTTRVVSVRSSEGRVPSGGLLYALPKTEICVDVTFIHRDTTQAPYADYAAEMLSDIQLADAYRIAEVHVSTRLVADESHFYYVLPRRNALQIDQRHLLRAVGMDDCVDIESDGIDVEPDPEVSAAQRFLPGSNLYDRVDTVYRRGDRPGYPSLLLTRRDSRTVRQQAMAAADRLEELQEQRRQLADNEAEQSSKLQQVRQRMIDEQIAATVALFVGHEVRSTIRFVVTPSETQTEAEGQPQLLFLFSPSRGVVDTPSGDAQPVYYALQRDNSMKGAARFVRYHTGDATRIERRNSIKYRTSELAEFRIDCPFFQYRRVVPVAQYGPILELPSGRVKARFDAMTGELIYLSR